MTQATDSPAPTLQKGLKQRHLTMIATQPEERSTWLRHGIVADAREKFDVPVQHVVVHTPVAP
jgi:hypothetical protein